MVDARDADALGDITKVSVWVIAVLLICMVILGPVAAVAGTVLLITSRRYEAPYGARRAVVGGVSLVAGLAVIWFAWVPMFFEPGYSYLPATTDSQERLLSLERYQSKLESVNLPNVTIRASDSSDASCKVTDVQSIPEPSFWRHGKVPETAQITVYTDC